MKIAIFEDSFDPPLLSDARAAEELSHIADKVLIIPDNRTSGADKLKLCIIAFSDIENAEVSDIEIGREGKCYIAETLDILKGNYPNANFLIASWKDENIHEWFRIDYVMQNSEILVVDRDDNEERYSDVREKLPMRLCSDLVKDEVYEEIIKNNYYEAQPDLSWLREKAIDYLDESRIAHVAGCEQEAVKLAQFWGEDEDKAATAAILHDITKRCSYEEQLQMVKEFCIECDEEELKIPKLLHARTGAYIAKKEFGVSDEIYDAIRYHTTGRPDMTLLEKIIYLADYIEPNRTFEGVEKLRQLAYEDINKCMALGLEMSLDEIREKGQNPYKDTKEAFEYYAETK